VALDVSVGEVDGDRVDGDRHLVLAQRTEELVEELQAAVEAYACLLGELAVGGVLERLTVLDSPTGKSPLLRVGCSSRSWRRSHPRRSTRATLE
jgi:hypothetical protein